MIRCARCAPITQGSAQVGFTYDTAGRQSTLTLPNALTDASGAIKTNYAYEPYGTTTTTGELNANATQYNGRESDGTGLYYYRERYYHPGFGRFISEDRIGLMGGPNLYAYVSGDPVTYVDPDGNAKKRKKMGCLNCGALHGGLYGPYCPDCYTKSKDPNGGVPPIWEPPTLPITPSDPTDDSCKDNE